ncbi:hypothetical protein V8E53_008795, partial [Lactarius tabidus]
MSYNSTITRGVRWRNSTTIGALPDNVLLDIFVLYRNDHNDTETNQNHTYDVKSVKARALVHVCQRWRQIIFESPRRLHLKIRCTHGTPVKKCLSIWPKIPIHVAYYLSSTKVCPIDEENISIALQHPDRVSHLALDVDSTGTLEKLATLIQKPFPVLTHLSITSGAKLAPLLPVEFAEILRGSASSFQRFSLFFISFPAWPTLLSSARDLVTLDLDKIPPSDYISPEALVACLAALPRLKTFDIRFHSPTPRLNHIHPHHITRILLPALNDFRLHGAGEYLEDFTARIDCPRLNSFNLVYFGQLVDLRVTQILKFFERLLGPGISPFTKAKVRLDSRGVTFHTYRPTNHPGWDWHLARTIVSSLGTDWEASPLTHMLHHFSPMLSTVVYLKLVTNFWPIRVSETDIFDWQRLLRQLSTVRALCVSRPLAGRIAQALKSFTEEMVAEAFSSLDLIYLENQEAPPLENFAAIRQLSGRPITMVDTVAEFDQRLECYL